MAEQCSEVKEGALATDSGWAQVEFEEISLGDQRLEKRFLRVCEELSGRPEYPINQASQDSAATKAAYRLFDNERLTPARILTPHRERTTERMREEEVVLAIQDTTYFNFTSHKKTLGLGPIGSSSGTLQGIVTHSTFAVTPKGLPLGLLNQKSWVRDGFRESENEHVDLPIEEKESYRWVEAIRDTSNIVKELRSTIVVTVADRESDIYEFLREAQDLNAKYVIRAAHDRRLVSEEIEYLRTAIDKVQPQGITELEIQSEKRTVEFDITFLPVIISPPYRKAPRGRKSPISCWVIYACERNSPPGKERLTWTLITNVPITSLEQAVEKVMWYRRRWSIEEFHKVLKSGCLVEDCRLQTADRLCRYLALFSVVAWRIFWMVHIRRTDPDADAGVVLTQVEIKTLQSLKRFKAQLSKPKRLTVRHVVTAIGCLGGYLNRRSDPPPGATAIWRGWQRLASMTEVYEGMTECG